MLGSNKGRVQELATLRFPQTPLDSNGLGMVLGNVVFNGVGVTNP